MLSFHTPIREMEFCCPSTFHHGQEQPALKEGGLLNCLFCHCGWLDGLKACQSLTGRAGDTGSSASKTWLTFRVRVWGTAPSLGGMLKGVCVPSALSMDPTNHKVLMDVMGWRGPDKHRVQWCRANGFANEEGRRAGNRVWRRRGCSCAVRDFIILSIRSRYLPSCPSTMG